MRFVIDRIEEDIAICQNLDSKEMIEIQIEQLPQGIKDGMVLVLQDGKYIVDEKEEEIRKTRIEKKMNNLWI